MNKIEAVPSADLYKWLRLLILRAAVGMALSCLSMITLLGSVPGWISQAVLVVTIVALFRLSGVNPRYRKAWILLAIGLVGGVLGSLLKMSLLTLAASVCSLVGYYQEYNGHSELVADRDAKLSGKWHGLFTWQMVVGILGGLVSTIGTVVAVVAQVETGSIVSGVVVFVGLLGLATQVLYLMYMKKTVSLFA